MKVLIATDTYYPHVNGASYFTQRLAQALAERSHQVLVVAPGRGWRKEEYQHQGVSVIGLPAAPTGLTNFRIAVPFGLTRGIRALVAEWVPDIVHVQGHFFIGRAALAAARECGIPSIGTNHFMPENLIHYIPAPRWLRARIRWWMWRDWRRVFSGVAVITTPTATAAALLRQHMPDRDITVVSCGVDRRIWHPGQSGDYLRQRYRLPDKPLLLYVGRLDREKNVDFILKALAVIPRDHRPHFLIAGRGAEEQRLSRLAADLKVAPDVMFVGFVANEDLPALYCLADVFIMAGTAELQSLVTMEAMASGSPILAIDAMALPELVHHGKNGYLFSGHDTAEAAEYMQRLMTDVPRRRAMGQASLTFIQEHDLERVMQRYESLYRGAAAAMRS